jgi:hypothetical protein
MMLCASGLALALVGAGPISVDRVLDQRRVRR